MFCSQCGTPLSTLDAFCTQCGASTGAPAPGSSRRVLPQVVQVKGFLGQGTLFMNLVVTDQGLILACQPDSLETEMDALTDLLDEALQRAGPDWRQIAEKFAFPSTPWERYLIMEPQAILAEERHNRLIRREELRAVRLTLDEDPESHSDTLILETDSDTLDLDLPWGNGHLAHQILSGLSVVQME